MTNNLHSTSKKNKLDIRCVYFIFPIMCAISALLKLVFNSCLVVLEPLALNTADLHHELIVSISEALLTKNTSGLF